MIVLFIRQVTAHIKAAYAQLFKAIQDGSAAQIRSTAKVRRTIVTRVHEAVKAIALCHNVTPVFEEEGEESDEPEADQQLPLQVTYQASSPDEVSRLICIHGTSCQKISTLGLSMVIALPTLVISLLKINFALKIA